MQRGHDTLSVKKIILLRENTMNSKDLTIKIIITDGEREAKGNISLDSYRDALKFHNISLVDEITKTLLDEIEKTSPQTNQVWEDDPWLSDGDMPKNI
jgi:hypothetical protein